MTNTLLQSLRERILDESEPLAGLLRKCLALGAETGSTALRDWARSELNGYSDGVGVGDTVPSYRLLHSPPIKMDSISGNYRATGQMIHRLQLPPDTHEFVPERFPLRQPVEELENLSQSPSISFSSGGLAYAQILWNSQLGSFQQVTGLSYTISGSTLTGVLSQVRTQLVEVVLDLTADTPLSELPKKEQVDSAVSHHIGAQYNTTIQSANGPTAIGTKAKATTNGLNVEDAIARLDALKATAQAEVDNDRDKAELLGAIADLRAVATQATPNTGEVMTRVGKLRTLSDRIGVPALSAAVGGASEALINLALSGVLG